MYTPWFLRTRKIWLHNNVVRGDFLQPPHRHLTPAVVSNIKLMKGKALRKHKQASFGYPLYLPKHIIDHLFLSRHLFKVRPVVLWVLLPCVYVNENDQLKHKNRKIFLSHYHLLFLYCNLIVYIVFYHNWIFTCVK